MRHSLSLLPLFLLALGCSTSTGFYTASYSETQACVAGTCAGTTPTSVSVGANLSGVAGFRLRICAASGQTLSGAGTMQAWLCDATNNLCYRDTGLDQTVSASSVRCATFPDFSVSYITEPADTVEFVASGVTASGGANLTVEVQTRRERR